MFILVSFTEVGYSLIHQSEDFNELCRIQENPSILDLDGLVVDSNNFDHLESTCVSQKEVFPSFSDIDNLGNPDELRLFILDQEFVEYLLEETEKRGGFDSEEFELCEMLINLFPEPHHLEETLQHSVAA